MISDVIPARQAVLNVARSLAWVRETGGQNRGEAVEAILRSCALDGGNSWCVAFCNYVGRGALGGLWPLPMVGGTETLYTYAKSHGILREEPTSGAIFLIHSDEPGRRVHHAGFCDLPPTAGNPAWWTIEGNASKDGGANGDGVYVLDRRVFDPRDRFVWWWA